MKKKKRDGIEMAFNIIGGKRNNEGELTGLVTDTGFILMFADPNGEPCPLKEEVIGKPIDEFIGGNKS